ncbi:rhodanese-like domain-containing protein [Niveibacterium sp.]|uniref:rhodanese-like domain-containing protein n=1 Tax=Niveibacterium sp. TaxID=2017444 RepID=UPI0035B4C1E9
MQRRGFLQSLLVCAGAALWASAVFAAAPVVIDVRTPEEFAAGHVEGAMNVPYEQIGGRIAALAPGKDTPVVLYCKSGRRAGIALQTLREMGYSKVENFGGFEDARKRLAGGCSAGTNC